MINLRRFTFVLSFGLFMLAIFQIISFSWSYLDNRLSLNEARELYHAQEKALSRQRSSELEKKTDTLKRYNTDLVSARFESLLQLNPDIIGWIKVADSSIDYPVLQGKDNDYYLTHNFKQEYTRAGSIFMDYRNRDGFQARHVILYGHQMKDGSMFGELKYYKDANYYKSHRTITIDFLTGRYLVEVFAVYSTTIDFNYIQTEFIDDRSYAKFRDEIQYRSMYPSDLTLSVEDRLITLSTCDYSLDAEEGRLVVHGRITSIEAKVE